MVLSVFGSTNGGTFQWKEAIIDALIMSMLTFFTTLGALGITNLLTGKEGWLAAGISAGTEFFAILALKRGFVKKE